MPIELLAASSLASTSRIDPTGDGEGHPTDTEKEQDRERERLNEVRYPFAKSAQLLRRFGSVEGLDELDDDDEEGQEGREFADDFSSEVSLFSISLGA